MKAVIQNASKEHLPGILEIYNDAILTTTAVYDYNPHTLEMRTKWFEDKVRDNIPVLVAIDENKILGFASYGPFRPWAAYRYTVEHSIYVHKDHRGLGIAKALLAELIAIAGKKDVHTMMAGIDATNEISLNLHRRFNFREVGHLEEVGYKFGRWLDLKFLELKLDNGFTPNAD